MLQSHETERYARHIVLRGIGGPGQNKLKAAKVLVIGAGGLGSPVIAYLAAAGVGTLTIVDDDDVSLSNLQRQIVHNMETIDHNKAQSAAEFALQLNNDIDVNFVPDRLDPQNVDQLLQEHDIIVDGTDRFSTRAFIAQSAQRHACCLVSGAVSMFDGQVTVFAPHLKNPMGIAHPSFQCLYPDTPDEVALPTCETVGILGAVTGVIGTLMAMETIKLITDLGEPLYGRLLLYDGRAAKFTELAYARRQQK